jgi:hypothetical protein
MDGPENKLGIIKEYLMKLYHMFWISVEITKMAVVQKVYQMVHSISRRAGSGIREIANNSNFTNFAIRISKIFYGIQFRKITNNINFDKICDSYFEDNKSIPGKICQSDTMSFWLSIYQGF